MAPFETEPGGGAFSASAENLTALGVGAAAFLERLSLGAGDGVTAFSLSTTVIVAIPTTMLFSFSSATGTAAFAVWADATRDADAGVMDAGGGATEAAFLETFCAEPTRLARDLRSEASSGDAALVLEFARPTEERRLLAAFFASTLA